MGEIVLEGCLEITIEVFLVLKPILMTSHTELTLNKRI